MLRRQAGAPIRAEAYFISEISLGRVGAASGSGKAGTVEARKKKRAFSEVAFISIMLAGTVSINQPR